jgi:hypothetical protein
MFAPLAAGMAERTAGLALALASSLVDLVLVLVITFYFLLDERRLRVALFRTVEPQRRPAVRRVFQEVSSYRTFPDTPSASIPWDRSWRSRSGLSCGASSARCSQ